MNTQLLVEEAKARFATLTKPYKLPWYITGLIWAYKFVKNAGEPTLPLLGLLLLLLFLSCSPRFAPGIPGIQLLGRRAIALATDLLFISVASFASLFLFQSKDYLGQLAMAVLWITFLYFVFFDWRFRGTPGKQLWGLKVVTVTNTQIDFCKSFLRVFMTLPLPIICSGFLRDTIMGDSNSRFRFILGDGLAGVTMYFIPMSIMFLGGNESIADKILGVSVERKQAVSPKPERTRPSVWVLLSCSTLLWAFLLTAVYSLTLWPAVTTGRLPENPPAKDLQQSMQITTDPITTAQLWAALSIGLKEPASTVRKIEIFEMSPNPYKFRPGDSHVVTPLNPEQYLNGLKQIRLVRVTLVPYMSTLTKLLVIDNFLGDGGRNPNIKRPTFALMQIASEQKYGLFSIYSDESILFCWMGSGTTPVDFPMDVYPHYAIRPIGSFGEIYNLLVGRVTIVYDCCA